MTSKPPMRPTQSRYWKSTRPSTVAVAPSARKTSVKPVTNSSEWMSAMRRDRCTSSRLSPVMKLT